MKFVEVLVARMGKYALKSGNLFTGFKVWVVLLVTVMAYAVIGGLVFQQLVTTFTTCRQCEILLREKLLSSNMTFLNVSHGLGDFLRHALPDINDFPNLCETERGFPFWLRVSFNIMFTAGTPALKDFPNKAKIFSIPFIICGTLLSATYIYASAKYALPVVVRLDTFVSRLASSKHWSPRRKKAARVCFVLAAYAAVVSAGGAIYSANDGKHFLNSTYDFFLSVTLINLVSNRSNTGIGLTMVIIVYQLLAYSFISVCITYLLALYEILPCASKHSKDGDTFRRKGKYKVSEKKARKISAFYINEGFQPKPTKSRTGKPRSESIKNGSLEMVEAISIRSINLI